MATTPAYWTSSTRGGSSRATERRASEDAQFMYNPAYASMPVYPARTSEGSDEHRSPSSGSSGTSSSLTGAMGNEPVIWGMPPQAPYNMPTYMDAQQPASTSSYAGYRGSPESLSPPSPSPFTPPHFNDPFHPASATTPYPPASSTPAPGVGFPPISPHEDEVRRLKRRLREVEKAYERAMQQVKALEARPAPQRTNSLPSPPMATPLGAPVPPSPGFMASWKVRTDARIRQFCSLNRAGNALCAWHDSRRERRVHPPRMAPPGYLNCGCTFEEALFEESLARHHVGSYLPGDSVRMDPALRNPLLKLLQARYGYKDGDFERDPRTGDWIPGEGPAVWEQQVQSGAPNPRRERR